MYTVITSITEAYTKGRIIACITEVRDERYHCAARRYLVEADQTGAVVTRRDCDWISVSSLDAWMLQMTARRQTFDHLFGVAVFTREEPKAQILDMCHAAVRSEEQAFIIAEDAA